MLTDGLRFPFMLGWSSVGELFAAVVVVVVVAAAVEAFGPRVF